MPEPTTLTFTDAADATVQAGRLARTARLLAVAMEGLDCRQNNDLDAVKSVMNELVHDLEVFAAKLAGRAL